MTLNQIKKKFAEIATNHKQINTFGYGDIWEIATSGTIEYPLMWVKLEPFSIQDKVQKCSYKIIMMDIVGNGEVNENEVLSDQLEICKDIIGQLQHPAYDWDIEVGTLEPFTERFNDSVSGWVIDVTLRLPFTYDRCAAPYTGNTEPTSNAGYVTIYNPDGTVFLHVPNNGSYDLDGNIIME